MGPAVLITLGVLFLLSQATNLYWLEFNHTWPALLIVIGLVLFLQHSSSAQGHVPREYTVPQPGQPYAVAQTGAVVTPAPAPPGGNLPPAQFNQPGGPANTEVNNG
jgi:hypothetical protein